MRPAAAAADAFRVAAGRSPDGVWCAPGRVNLLGEHTDYNDGYALPFALDLGVTAAVAVRADARLRLWSAQEGGPVDVAAGERAAGWAAYVAGALAVAAPRVGFDVWVDADLPVGSGLSSSAALTCAVVLAAAELTGAGSDRVALARLAQRAEREHAGVPVGLLDQLASLLATPGHALLVDFRATTAEPVPLDPAGAGLTLVVLDTRAPRRLADGAYAARRAECARAAGILGVPSLREADPGQVDRLPEPLRRRARHVVSENARVLAAAGLLRAGRLADVGEALSASHASLRDDYEVSCAELDAAVGAALEAGALGARMTGAGFGGAAVALVPAGRVADVGRAAADRARREGLADPRCFPVSPSVGARRLA